MHPVKVTCAIIEKAGKVLLAQRGPPMDLPNKWEFPGGKVRQGESPSVCLVREIKEELGIDITVKKALPPHRHSYDHISIELLPFICSVSGGSASIFREMRDSMRNPACKSCNRIMVCRGGCPVFSEINLCEESHEE